jgi:hypothetical protein
LENGIVSKQFLRFQHPALYNLIYILDIPPGFLVCRIAEKVCEALLVKILIRVLDNIKTLGNLGTRPVKNQWTIKDDWPASSHQRAPHQLLCVEAGVIPPLDLDPGCIWVFVEDQGADEAAKRCVQFKFFHSVVKKRYAIRAVNRAQECD